LSFRAREIISLFHERYHPIRQATLNGSVVRCVRKPLSVITFRGNPFHRIKKWT